MLNTLGHHNYTNMDSLRPEQKWLRFAVQRVTIARALTRRKGGEEGSQDRKQYEKLKLGHREESALTQRRAKGISSLQGR